MHASIREHCSGAYLDKSCGTLNCPQLILVNFLVTRKTIERTHFPFSQRIRPDGTPVVSHACELDWALQQLRACVKWDLVDRVDRDFFHISNFVRQYFRFRSVNFFSNFRWDRSDAHLYHFFKILWVGKKKLKSDSLLAAGFFSKGHLDTRA